jgi:hypothetical protein
MTSMDLGKRQALRSNTAPVRMASVQTMAPELKLSWKVNRDGERVYFNMPSTATTDLHCLCGCGEICNVFRHRGTLPGHEGRAENRKRILAGEGKTTLIF